MVRVPAGWRFNGYINPPAQSGPLRGIVHHPIPRDSIFDYNRVVSGVILQPGQAQTIVFGGTARVTIGPAGLGNVWHPAQATVSTSTGALDTSVCTLFLGPAGQTVPNTQVGASQGGAGTIALAIPPMTPGQYLTAVWTGANNGDLATINVVGTMDALAPGWRVL